LEIKYRKIKCPFCKGEYLLCYKIGNNKIVISARVKKLCLNCGGNNYKRGRFCSNYCSHLSKKRNEKLKKKGGVKEGI